MVTCYNEKKNIVIGSLSGRILKCGTDQTSQKQFWQIAFSKHC